MKFKYFCWLTLLFAFISMGVNAQTKVEGTVLDESSNPLIGVTVSTDDRKTGVVTDLDGHFTIDVPNANHSLTFSFVGYTTQKVALKGRKLLKVILKEDNELLDEVVVVGYGTQKKVSVTGSVAQVDNKELKKAPSGTLSSLLAGRLPGLVTRQTSGQPGQDGANLHIRGIGAGDGSALVVVDGVVQDYFPDFSPDEVESVTILKDAAAAAVYGVRASGGVILVTTKRGSTQKPTVSFNTALTLSQNTNFPKFLNGPDYAYWYNKAQLMDGVAEENLRFKPEDIERITNPGPDEEIYGSTDWFDLLFRDAAPTYTNTISVQGGNDRVKFFTSLGSYNQEGAVKRTSYDKYYFRSNLDAQITDNFDYSMNLYGSVDNQKSPGASVSPNAYAGVFVQAMLSYPFLKPYTKDGMPIASMNTDGQGNNNPLAARDLSGRQTSKTTKFQGDISLRYKLPLKGLSVKLDAAFLKTHTMRKAEATPYKVFSWNQTTHQGNVENGRIWSMASVSNWYGSLQRYTIRPTVEYNNTFGKHDVSALFLYEFAREDYEGISAGREDFPLTNIMDISYGNKVSESLVKGSHSNDKRAGYVMRLNYAYDQKYLFEFTGRIDASTALPKGNRWGFFPAVSLGYRVSEESFFKNALPFVDNFKLRGSVGRLGSDASISNTMTYFSTAGLSSDPCVVFGTNPYKDMGMSGPVCPDLKWQITDSYNIGFDADLWHGLLGVELDVFYMKTSRSLAGQSGKFPPSLGNWYPAYINYGSHDNRGFELVLTHRNKIKDFNYYVKGNVSFARNRILKTIEDADVPLYKRRTGKRIGETLGFVATGLFQSEEEIAKSAVFEGSTNTKPGDVKMKDINGDGVISWAQDMVPISRSSTPEMMFGLNIGGDWKGFDFNMFWQGAAMFDVDLCGIYDSGIRDNTFYTKPFYDQGNTPYYLVENSWTPEHTNAKYPRLGIEGRDNGGKFSSWWIKDGTYLRLKSAQIGYTLPKKLTNKIGFGSIRAYVSGSNLLTFCGLDYLDPEMPSVNQGYYPQQRTYEFGLNLTF